LFGGVNNMKKYKIISVEDLGLDDSVGEILTEETILKVIQAVEKKGFEFVQLIQICLDYKVIVRI